MHNVLDEADAVYYGLTWHGLVLLPIQIHPTRLSRFTAITAVYRHTSALTQVCCVCIVLSQIDYASSCTICTVQMGENNLTVWAISCSWFQHHSHQGCPYSPYSDKREHSSGSFYASHVKRLQGLRQPDARSTARLQEPLSARSCHRLLYPFIVWLI